MNIEQDIKDWSKNVLEVPNSYLKGIPACPYAKEAWKKNRVDVVETKEILEQTLNLAKDFDGESKDVLIIASYHLPDLEAFDSFIEVLNEGWGNDLHFMGFHPEYGAEEKELDFLYDHDWESSIEGEYCMVFIQNLSKVVEASDKLEKLGYYETYPEEEYQALVVNRKRKLKDGYETSRNEKDRDQKDGSRWHDEQK